MIALSFTLCCWTEYLTNCSTQQSFLFSTAYLYWLYDAVWDRVYISVPKTSEFQSGPSVVKVVLNTQCYQYLWLTLWFHTKDQKKPSKNQNRWFRYINWAPDRRNHQKSLKKKSITQSRFAHIFYSYGMFWMVPVESSSPGGSECVW